MEMFQSFWCEVAEQPKFSHSSTIREERIDSSTLSWPRFDVSPMEMFVQFSKASMVVIVRPQICCSKSSLSGQVVKSFLHLRMNLKVSSISLPRWFVPFPFFLTRIHHCITRWVVCLAQARKEAKEFFSR